MRSVIKVENLSKQYRLGEISTGALSHDINRWWHKIRGKENPYLRIGDVNDRSKKGKNEYVWSLKDINFEIQQGDAVGIIGRNGAGKSTLLKILSKVTNPTTGIIRTKGRIASLLEVGTGFHPDQTGKENIFLNGAILGMRKAEIKRKFDEIVYFAGVERYIDTPVKRYSSGMYVRLAFAVAAHLESEILIIDEVLAVGDAEFQKKCLIKMGQVSKGDGRTVLFVSHNMASIEALCSKGILLENGQLKSDGKINNVVADYLASTKNLIQHNSIKDRKDRRGNGAVKLTDFYFKNNKGDIISILKSGMSVVLCFSYECEFPEYIRDVDMGFSIHLQSELTISVVYTSYLMQEFTNIKHNGIFEFQIDKLALSKGFYMVGARIIANGEEADWINAMIANFEVESGDFYKTGIEGFGSTAPILIEGSWKQGSQN